jgi:hypothetical protein
MDLELGQRPSIVHPVFDLSASDREAADASLPLGEVAGPAAERMGGLGNGPFSGSVSIGDVGDGGIPTAPRNA